MIIGDNYRGEHRGAVKDGEALLAGILRCRRCGRKLTVRYTGGGHDILRYSCSRGWLDNGEPRCIAFGGFKVDDAIAAEVRRVVQPGAIEAAKQAQQQEVQQRDEVRAALLRDLEADALLRSCLSTIRRHRSREPLGRGRAGITLEPGDRACDQLAGAHRCS